ncbi:protein CreA [Pseudodesulfovibrio cashew]|uniref:Protein CreA n=2 Tax=Pseudodesulfovibrio cashew TaxID=2678688 RepID=A0A6I6JB01_9BACT|nr:CreA family protein [Pseudodesulfovibrio cashew]QGY39946.1 protein CreA [Pseudodesulfovibrio cashew]
MQSLDFYSKKSRSGFGFSVQAVFFALVLCMLTASPVASETIGSVDTVFHMFSRDDDIVLEAFDDPEVSGVTCYLSRARKGGVKGMIGVAEDPSDASLECIRTGPIKVPEDVKNGKRDGKRLFKKNTSLVFKSMQVVRFYDKKRNVLVYMVYSDKLVEGSPKNSVSAVKVE